MPRCIECGEAHLTHKCDEFRKLSANERYKRIQSNGACLNCLHPMHVRRDCKSKHKCSKCQRNHHTLLHFEEKPTGKNEPKIVALTQNMDDTVLLATSLLFCYNSNGDCFLMRAMIDQGNMATIITERAAQMLRTPRKHLRVPITAVGDITTTTTKPPKDLM